MHRRKIFVVYPPNYNPENVRVLFSERVESAFQKFTTPVKPVMYKRFKSLRQAKKQAFKWGKGSEIIVDIFEHPGKFKHWNHSFGKLVGEIV